MPLGCSPHARSFVRWWVRRDAFPVAPSLPWPKLPPVRTRTLFGLLVSVCMLAGCRSASYWAWDKLGYAKRDLLKKDVVAARDGQKAASEQFQDALTRLRELYGSQGSSLEKAYDGLKSDYDRCVARADTVHKRVRQVETVAADLFKEWEKELQEISSATLRESSRKKLQQTRGRYDELHAALKRAESSMDPVLVRFKDQVLFLKHNLNAEAVASLKGETTSIQTEIARLIDQMNQSITRADEFVKTLN